MTTENTSPDMTWLDETSKRPAARYPAASAFAQHYKAIVTHVD